MNKLTALQNILIGKKLNEGKYYTDFPELYEMSHIEDININIHSVAEENEPRDSKGRKISQKYYYKENLNIVIAEKFFQDIFNEEDVWVGVEITIKWYKWRWQDPETKEWSPLEVAHEKAPFIVPIGTKSRRRKLLSKRRKYNIEYLTNIAEALGVVPEMERILAFFHKEVSLFERAGTDDFKNGLLTVTDTQIAADLQKLVPDGAGGMIPILYGILAKL